MLSPASRRLLEHLLADRPFGPLLASADRPKHRREWLGLVVELAACAPSDPEEAERFHDHWHVCHHYLRQLIDDEPAVLDMLRGWLPPYAGPSLTLYRGENVDRMEAGRLGIAWTPEIETARMFARGLNATGKGGVLLRTTAQAKAIIAGPSRNSRRLNEREFTVDPRQIEAVVELGRFPAVF